MEPKLLPPTPESPVRFFRIADRQFTPKQLIVSVAAVLSLFSGAGYFLQNFLQLRGVVNLAASRFNLILAGICIAAACYVLTIPSQRRWIWRTSLLFVIIGLGIGLDWITPKPREEVTTATSQVQPPETPSKSDVPDLLGGNASPGQAAEYAMDHRVFNLFPEDMSHKRAFVQLELMPVIYEEDGKRTDINGVEVAFGNNSESTDRDVSINLWFFPKLGNGYQPTFKDIDCHKSNRVEIVSGSPGTSSVTLLVHELIPHESHECRLPFTRPLDGMTTVTQWKNMYGEVRARSNRRGNFDVYTFRLNIGAKGRGSMYEPPMKRRVTFEVN